MVWQVRENGHSNHDIDQNHQTIKTTATVEHVEKKISSASSKLEVESRSSRGSSSSKSVDLGPAPGSGIVTASVSDISEASDNESGNGSSHNRHLPSMGVEMTESMTLNQQMAPSSLMQFNQDVESMLQHGAMRAAMNQSSSNNETLEPETSKLEVESRSSRGSSSSKSVDLEPKEDFTQHF